MIELHYIKDSQTIAWKIVGFNVLVHATYLVYIFYYMLAESSQEYYVGNFSLYIQFKYNAYFIEYYTCETSTKISRQALDSL